LIFKAKVSKLKLPVINESDPLILLDFLGKTGQNHNILGFKLNSDTIERTIAHWEISYE